MIRFYDTAELMLIVEENCISFVFNCEKCIFSIYVALNRDKLLFI